MSDSADISVPETQSVPAAVEQIFGKYTPLAIQFHTLLMEHGVERGLIGPRELDRLWDRHVLNSAVIGEQIPSGSSVIDVGSGAGLPGIPLAIARPDLSITLVEPMARRVAWLSEVIESLDLAVTVVRGRAEEKLVRQQIGLADVVTARAVAPLARLAGWCLPLTKPGGKLVALKGTGAVDEIERDGAAVRKAGGGQATLAHCGVEFLATPTTVVVIERTLSARSRSRKK